MARTKDKTVPRWFVQVQSWVSQHPRLVGVYTHQHEAAMVHAALAKLLEGQLGSVRTSSPGARSWITLTRNGSFLNVDAVSPEDRRTMPRVLFQPKRDSTEFLRARYAGTHAIVVDILVDLDPDRHLYEVQFHDNTRALVRQCDLA